MTGKGEQRFRFLKALLICLVLATAINGIPNLLTTNATVGDVMTRIGISAIGYWLIYLMFVGVAAAVRKLKGTDIGASDAANTESEAASEGKTWAVMKLKNLNGWQRLGILLSAIWLAVVVVGTVVLIFEETDRLKVRLGSGRALVHSEWVNASIETVWQDPSNVARNAEFGFVPDADQSSALEEVRNRYGDIDDVRFVERYQTANPDVNFGPVNAEHGQLLDEVQIKYQRDRERAVLRISGYAFLFWAVPSILVYLFAWGVLWVWRGFKEGDSND